MVIIQDPARLCSRHDPDLYGVVTTLQQRAEQYGKPARVLGSPRSEIEDLKHLLALERGKRNAVECELAKAKVINQRLADALGDMQYRVLSAGKTRPATINQVKDAWILALAAEHYEIDGEMYTSAHMLRRSRAVRYSKPRQICMWLCRTIGGQSFPVIAREFGGLDHSTVVHACTHAPDSLARSPVLREAVLRVQARFAA